MNTGEALGEHAAVENPDRFGGRVREFVLAGVATVLVSLAVTNSTFLVVVACLSLAIIALMRFEFFVYGLIFLLPWYPLLDAKPPFRDIFLLLRFALLAGVWIIRKRQGKSVADWILGSKLKKGVLVFAGVATLSLLISSVPANADAYRSLVRLFSYLAIFFAIAGWVENRRQLTAIIQTMLLSTIGVALFGFYQVYEKGYTDLYFHLYPLQEDALEPWTGRITSLLFHFNSLAGYLNLVLPFAVAAMVLAKTRVLRVLAMVCQSAGLAALYLTASRGGLIAYGGMLFVTFFFLVPKRAAFGKILISLLLAASLVLSMQESGTLGRVQEVDDFTQTTRLALWTAAGMMFLGHPVLGVGFGDYRSLYNDYLPGVRPNELDAHNLYLQLLAETGVVGFLIFCLLMVAFARLAIKSARQPDPLYRLVGIGVGGALAATLIHGMVDYIFNVSPQSGGMLWLVLGLGVVLSRFPTSAESSC
ncbi:MAG TPA: O-antigen ligase family protein [Terriglobales bacterium]